MTWSPDSSIAGINIGALASPTYGLVADLTSIPNAVKKAVSTLGGTQANVTANSAAYPFDVTFTKPANYRRLPSPNPVTGKYPPIPSNQYKIVIRKGLDVASGVPATAVIRLTVDVPAGAETYSPAQLNALCSFLTGLLTEEGADLADTLITGVV
jgi:hypothetical protein